ncbi:MAG TPA: hypothetical protein VE258_11700, partial [Ktedonobacterales bacterium]|nr:hypothetical protein [Ktedonobacterales bacterium]
VCKSGLSSPAALFQKKVASPMMLRGGRGCWKTTLGVTYCFQYGTGFAGVGDSIEQINQRLDGLEEQGKEVDQRLTRLEQQTAS